MAKKTIKQVVAWKAAFEEVIDHYQTVRSSNSAIRGLDYSRVEGGGRNPNLVYVSASDFICDVELAARSALKDRADLYQTFVVCYLDCMVEPNTETREIDDIRTSVGRVFTERKLSPVSSYMTPKPLDRKKAK